MIRWILLAVCAMVAQAGPPATPRLDHTETIHGVTVSDPYRWLETDSPEVRSWVKEQSAYARQYLDRLPGREAIRKRLNELSRVTQAQAAYGVGAVVATGGRLFYERQDPDQNQPALHVQERPGQASRVLIDPNQQSAAGISALTAWSPSPDGKLLAYGTSVAGSDWQVFRIRDVDTGKDLPDRLEWIKVGNVDWTPDGKSFLYGRYPEVPQSQMLTASNYFQKVFHHRVGSTQAEDRLVYERPDQKDWRFGAFPMQSGHLLIQIRWGTRRQHRIVWQDPAKPGHTLDLVSDFENTFDPVGHRGTVVYFRTTHQAPRGRVIAVDLRAPTRDNWREVVPQSNDTLERCLLVGDRVLCQAMRDVKSVLSIWDAGGGGKLDHEVPMTEIGSAGWARQSFLPSPVPSDTSRYYYFTGGFTRPRTMFAYDPQSRKSSALFDARLPFDPAAFETRQVFYPSKDGTRIPMFLVGRKGFRPNGATPTLLYGYGGFSIPMLPVYGPLSLAWVEAGGIYAVANLRGGNEYGTEWHRAGALDKKQNVFDDFIAAAEWLIKSGYTSSKRLAIYGGSNGGLLVGACLNQRPDLFGAAIPAVGVMDMLRFHRFTVGAGWTSDYGSPDNPRDFAVLWKYSPLHNIKRGTKYPPTLVMTADHDDRVVPLHSFKYGAALQYAQEGPAPILLRIDIDAGHGRGKPVSKQVESSADVLLFLRESLGVMPSAAQ